MNSDTEKKDNHDLQDSSASHRMTATPQILQEIGQLTQAIVELRAAIRARDEFISMIGHEMRNPMTPLLMQVTSLRESVRNPNAKPDRILHSIALLETMVEHFMRRASVLLDVSRMNSGIYCLEPVQIDAARIARQVVARMNVQAHAAGCLIEADIQETLMGCWDPLAIEQIADNLLSNAIKYGEGKPVRITLSLVNDQLWLRVADQGTGIAEQDRGRIFDRFERAAMRGRVGGFGIGLWLVGRLVHEMRGEIDVSSTLGEGTSFVVRLPLQLREDP